MEEPKDAKNKDGIKISLKPDKEFDEIMEPFDGIIDTDLAVRAYDAVLKESSSKKCSDSNEEAEKLKKALGIENMDLETFLQTLEIQIADPEDFDRIIKECEAEEEKLSKNPIFPASSLFFGDNDDEEKPYNKQNLTEQNKYCQSLSSPNSDTKKNYKEKLSRSGTYYDPKNYNQKNSNYSNQNASASSKKPYFEEGFDFHGTTMFEFEEFLKRTRVPTMEEEAAAEKAKKAKNKS